MMVVINSASMPSFNFISQKKLAKKIAKSRKFAEGTEYFPTIYLNQLKNVN